MGRYSQWNQTLARQNNKIKEFNMKKREHILLIIFLHLVITSCKFDTMKDKLLTEQIVGQYTYTDSVYVESEKQFFEQTILKVKVGDKVLEVSKLIYEDFQKARKLIEESDFKPLPYSAFRKRILQLYNVDMDTTYYHVLAPTMDTDHITDIVVHSGYLMPMNGGWDDIDEENIVMYNKMILNDDSISFNLLKSKAPFYIISQVQELGVTSNEKWLDYAFSHSEFNKTYVLHDYIFGATRNDDKYHLRKKMLDIMIEKGVDMSLLSSVLETVEYSPKMYAGNPEEIIGYLYKKIAEVGQYGYIEYRLDNDKDLIHKFKEKNYYGSEDLKSFCEDDYITKEERKKQGKSSSLSPEPVYKILDSDGYVNMRKEGNTSAEIIEKIPSGKTVVVLSKNANGWWKIQINDKVGFVHSSRIILYTITQSFPYHWLPAVFLQFSYHRGI